MKGLIFITLMFLVSCGGDSRTPKKIMRENVGSSVVRIFGVTETGRRSGGTGFSVKAPSGLSYILTNKHICGLATNGLLTIEFPKLERKYERRVLEISKEHDLCLVESLPVFKKSLKLAKTLETGETIYVVGHPKLYALTVTEGEYIEEAKIRVAMSKSKPVVIRDFFKVKKSFNFSPNIKIFRSARFNVYSRGGNSGSPIVNTSGEVVSVLFAGNRSDVMETYGVPHRFVSKFLSGY